MERVFLPTNDPQFDNFLFAAVAEGRNGMQVSVLSALARLGVDPWQEAKVLAGISKEAAHERLDGLIVGLPRVPSLIHDHKVIAERLVAQLPRLSKFRGPAGTSPVQKDALAESRNFMTVMFIILMLVAQAFFLAQAPSEQDDGTAPPVSGAAVATK
jgi:hypothetical protein